MVGNSVTFLFVDPAKIERLREVASSLENLKVERDQLVVQLRKEGGSLREIAEILGLTHPAVLKILARNLDEV